MKPERTKKHLTCITSNLYIYIYTYIFIYLFITVIRRVTKCDSRKFLNFQDGWVLRIHTNDLKILLGDFNAKVGRENIFKQTINEILHQDGNDNGVRIVNFVTSKNLVVKSTETFISTTGLLLIGRRTTRLITY
jgi:hypothetical protein